MLKRCSRPVVLLLLTTGLAVLLPAQSARAADPVYTITDVSRAWYYEGLSPELTLCESKYENPMVLDLAATVANPTWDGQVYVEGLRVEFSLAGKLVGTVPTLEAYLDPGEQGGTFLYISCRAWNDMLAKGFGGPKDSYQVKIVGPGQAFDTNDGSPAGTVMGSDTAFPVTLRQFARTAKLHGAKVHGGDVKISASLREWAKAAGAYGWRAAGGVRVVLLKLHGSAYRRVDTATTSRSGDFAVRFHAQRDNYIRLKVNGHTTAGATYYVTRSGEISFTGR